MKRGYAKRERIMILGQEGFDEVMTRLSDLGVDGTAIGLKREDGLGQIYWIRFKATLPLFEKLRNLAKKKGDLVATTGYGY